jgi:hypothetical protein
VGKTLALRLGQRARLLAIAAFASVVVLFVALPARADDTAARPAAAKRTTTYTSAAAPATIPGASANRGETNFSNGFVYFPNVPQGVNVGGRVPVGKSRLYVPYYGNVSNDPTHPGVQGTTGLAYGFRTWDISVLNSAFGTQQTLPGVEPPKTNPALSLSIRF